MSPRLSTTDFPRLSGASNFEVWKTRVEAALDGKGLLGFLKQRNYQGEYDSGGELGLDDLSGLSNEDLLDAAARADYEELRLSSDDEAMASPPSSTYDSSDAGDQDASELPSDQATITGPATLPQHLQELRTQRHGRSRQRQLNRMEKQAKAFIIKTIDDTHTLIVKDLNTAYEIYTVLCKKSLTHTISSISFWKSGMRTSARKIPMRYCIDDHFHQ